MPATDKRASELTAPVSIADTDVIAGYRPGTGGNPNLDIQVPVGLIRAPILAGLADGTVAVAGLPTAKAAGALADGSTDAATAVASWFAANDALTLTPGSYVVSSLVVPYGKTLVIQRGAMLQLLPTANDSDDHALSTIDVKGTIRMPDAVFGPAGACGAIGDSRATGSYWNNPGSTTKTLNSIWTQIEMQTFGALRYSVRHSMATGGHTTLELDPQITSLLALSDTPRYCYVLIGTNDGVEILWHVQYRRIVNAWLRLLSRGILPIHVADLPRVVSTYGATRSSRNLYVSRLLLDLSAKMGIPFINPTPDLLDYSNTNGDRLASLYSNGTDELHQGPKGSQVIATAAVSVLGSALVVPRFGMYSSKSSYDAFESLRNRGGNWYANPFYIGNSGTVGTGGTGSAPTGHTVSRQTGSDAFVSSVDARADGKPGYWWRCTVGSNTSAVLGVMIENTYGSSPYQFAAGEEIVLACDVLASGLTGRASPQLEIYFNGIGGTVSYTAGQNTSGLAVDGASPAVLSGRLIAGPFPVPAGTTNIRVRQYAYYPSGSQGVIAFGNPFFGRS